MNFRDMSDEVSHTINKLDISYDESVVRSWRHYNEKLG